MAQRTLRRCPPELGGLDQQPPLALERHVDGIRVPVALDDAPPFAALSPSVGGDATGSRRSRCSGV